MAQQNVNFEINDARALTFVAFDQVGNAVSVVSISDIFNQRHVKIKEMYLDKALERFGQELKLKLLQ